MVKKAKSEIATKLAIKGTEKTTEQIGSKTGQATCEKVLVWSCKGC